MIPYFNIIMLDLTIFNNANEIKDFLISCNLFDKIDYENMWQCRKGEFTSGRSICKIWFDAKTFGVIAYSVYDSQDFTTEFVDYLQNLKPLEYGKKIETYTETEDENESNEIEDKELSVDSILDKIRIKGINSLTQEEKNFLDTQS